MGETRSAVREMLIAGGLLLGFALAGVGMVAFTYDQTLERIEDNRQMTVLRQLQTVVPPELYDNAPERDVVNVTDAARLGSNKPLPVYRARLNGEPAAAILTAVAPDGYAGDIVLLIGVLVDGTVSGVQVVRHQETPGLGDAIDSTRSNWMQGFEGRSLEDPERQAWTVGRDGGEFIHITGATVTSRAVIQAVRRALVYFEENQAALFAQTAVTTMESKTVTGSSALLDEETNNDGD